MCAAGLTRVELAGCFHHHTYSFLWASLRNTHTHRHTHIHGPHMSAELWCLTCNVSPEALGPYSAFRTLAIGYVRPMRPVCLRAELSNSSAEASFHG